MKSSPEYWGGAPSSTPTHLHTDVLLPPHGDTLVLGVGNPFCGDDGSGNATIEMLSRCNLPEGVWIEDAGTPGFGLLNFFEGWNRVIIVDAIQMGEQPGTWKRYLPEEITFFGEKDHLSVHAQDLVDGLTLAQNLGKLPEQIIIFGIEPMNIDADSPLSPQVRDALPDLVENILSELWNGKI
jgi:hydrogenase maturation protease